MTLSRIVLPDALVGPLVCAVLLILVAGVTGCGEPEEEERACFSEEWFECRGDTVVHCYPDVDVDGETTYIRHVETCRDGEACILSETYAACGYDATECNPFQYDSGCVEGRPLSCEPIPADTAALQRLADPCADGNTCANGLCIADLEACTPGGYAARCQDGRPLSCVSYGAAGDFPAFGGTCHEGDTCIEGDGYATCSSAPETCDPESFDESCSGTFRRVCIGALSGQSEENHFVTLTSCGDLTCVERQFGETECR